MYSRPTGIDAVSGATIESTKYNLNVQDVEADLNVARPISAGGTGATTPAGAMTALGGELAAQLVTNYDTFAFKAGSFYSAAGATSAPTADAAQGICYANAAGTDFYLEARSQLTNVKYVRRKTASVWGAWFADIASDTTKVNKAGDTMTGLLVLSADPGAALGAATKQYVDARDAVVAAAAPVPATVAPLADGTAAVGVATKYAREDHVHQQTAITALTSDVTASGSGSVPATLATVNSNVGSFGSATAIPVVTVNAKGLVTAASTAAIPAGRWTLLNTLTASNSATLTDTTSLTATYNEYEFVFENITPVNAIEQLHFRVRSGGSIQTGTFYTYQMFGLNSAGTLMNGGGNISAGPLNFGGTSGIGNAPPPGGLCGYMRVYKPSGTTHQKLWHGMVTCQSPSFLATNNFAVCWYGGSGAIDGVEFAMSTGNIASGIIRVYGR